MRVLSILIILLTSTLGSSEETTEQSRALKRAERAEYRRAHKEPIGSEGSKVFIICFYGARDSKGLVEKECEYKFSQCKQRVESLNNQINQSNSKILQAFRNHYNNPILDLSKVPHLPTLSCERKNNPTLDEIKNLQGEGITVVVTHSTPKVEFSSLLSDEENELGEMSLENIDKSQCKLEVWDALEGINVNTLSENISSPIIWFGCYGKDASDSCSNVIALADESKMLDTTAGENRKAVACRYKATFYALEQIALKNYTKQYEWIMNGMKGRAPRSTLRDKEYILEMTKAKMKKLKRTRDPDCSYEPEKKPKNEFGTEGSEESSTTDFDLSL